MKKIIYLIGLLFMCYSCSQDELIINDIKEINEKSGNAQSIAMAKGPQVNLLNCPNGTDEYSDFNRDGDIEAILNGPAPNHLLVFFDMYVNTGTKIQPVYTLIPPYIAGGVVDIAAGDDRGSASFCENEVNLIYAQMGFCKNKSLKIVKKTFKYTVKKIIEVPSGVDVTSSYTINSANNQNITTVSFRCGYSGGGSIDDVFDPSEWNDPTIP